MRVRRLLVIAGFAVAIVASIIFWLQPSGRMAPQEPAPARPLPVSKTSGESRPQPLLGERILANYGNAARPPEDDLMWMARALENFALLVKGDNPLPLGANEDIANALRGRNKAQLRALPDQHPAFNAQGQLVDRWGTPLFFHARSRDRLDIRSAGPDRQMWTADDLHREANGRFLRGAALLAPSLFNDPPDPR